MRRDADASAGASRLRAPLLAGPAPAGTESGQDSRGLADGAKMSAMAKQRRRGRRGKEGLGTFEGVFMPCVASIVGAVLFLRLSWAVGEAGWGGVLLMFAIGTFVNLMTALSLAAISTNGSMKGGGAYYMISRSIGPELGVATGLVFCLSQCISATYGITAFAETFVDVVVCHGQACWAFHEDHQWLSVLVASLTLLATTVVGLVGSRLVAGVTNLITVFIMVSILLGAGSMLIGNGMASPAMDNLRENAWTSFTDGTHKGELKDGPQTFLSVFVIIFPAMTGVTSGANYSGKLRDPGRSIGRGTFSAIAFTTVLYVALIMIFALSFERDTLQHDKSIFRKTCFHPRIIVAGIMTCTLSSGLSNLVGSARLLQSLARDKLLPVFAPFGQGSRRGDDPQVAILFCWFVVQMCILYGKLDIIAALVTDCFLLVYLFLNLACFALRISGAPNFRPRFVYFSWKSALAGALSSLVVIFVTSPTQGMIALSVTVGFAYYVHVTAPAVPWGDVSQALIFHQVRKYLLRLDIRRSHPKFWRPSILFLPQDARGQLALIDFCNNLKKGGLYVIGNVVVAPPQGSPGLVRPVQRDMPSLAHVCVRLRQLWTALFEQTHAKAFHDVMVAPSQVEGMRALLIGAGLGGLRPNTVCLQFPDPDLARPGAARSAGSEDELPPPPPPVLTPVVHAASGEDLAPTSESGPDAANDLLCDEDSDKALRESRAVETFAQIQALLATHHGPRPVHAQRLVDFCEILADVLALEKNLLIAKGFENLNKKMIVDARLRRRRRLRADRGAVKSLFPLRNARADTTARTRVRSVDYEAPLPASPPAASERDPEALTTIDLWSTNESDWNDPAGTLALEMQLAFGLHRTDIWEETTRLRVIAACKSVTGDAGSAQARQTAEEAHRTLRQLLKAIRVEAEVVVLPAVGSQLFDGAGGRTRPLTQLEHCAHLNSLVIEHSARKACVVFLPLPRPLSHGDISPSAAADYLQNLEVLVQSLPPTILVSPGNGTTPIVTTEL